MLAAVFSYAQLLIRHQGKESDLLNSSTYGVLTLLGRV